MKNGFFKILKDTFFPASFTCDICGRETFNTNLCADCRKSVKFNNAVTCPLCGRETVRPEICLECKAQPPRYERAVSALVYEDGGQKLVSKFKNGAAYLKDYFADILYEKLKDFPKANCIIYVPMTKKTKRKRGYNQTFLLAKELSARTGIPLFKDALLKTKETSAQKGLTRKERAENLYGAFKVADKNSVKGKIILLVDDVLTTGATADELTRILLSAGADKVYLATVASVRYKNPSLPSSKS